MERARDQIGCGAITRGTKSGTTILQMVLLATGVLQDESYDYLSQSGYLTEQPKMITSFPS